MNRHTFKAVLLVCTFLGTQAIHAEIIYSGSDRDIVLDQFNMVQTIDIAGNSAAWDDLSIGLWINENPNSGFHTEAATLPQGQGNRVLTAASRGKIEKLPEHNTVNDSLNYTIAKSSFFNHQYSHKLESVESIGNFLNQTGYIALQLCKQDETYYGWARISVENYNRADVRLTVHDWAYNNTASQEILTKEQTAIPEPSSMAMTVACSCGLLFFRRIFLI